MPASQCGCLALGLPSICAVGQYVSGRLNFGQLRVSGLEGPMGHYAVSNWPTLRLPKGPRRPRCRKADAVGHGSNPWHASYQCRPLVRPSRKPSQSPFPSPGKLRRRRHERDTNECCGHTPRICTQPTAGKRETRLTVRDDERFGQQLSRWSKTRTPPARISQAGKTLNQDLHYHRGATFRLPEPAAGMAHHCNPNPRRRCHLSTSKRSRSRMDPEEPFPPLRGPCQHPLS
jgi:hypothetical protein